MRSRFWIMILSALWALGCDDGKVAGPLADADAGMQPGDTDLDAGDPEPDAAGGDLADADASGLDGQPGDPGQDAAVDGGDMPGDAGDAGPDGADTGVDAGGDLPDAGVDASADAADGGDGGCVDPCPFAGGVSWGCARRFMYGINYAWHHFAGDFGGISAWGQNGVSGHPEVIRAELADMRAHGVSVIRWWVFPDFRGDGVDFDASDNPTGLGGTALDDLAIALGLAEEEDVYYMLCIFSFDNFRPGREEYGIWVPGITPLVTDPGRRALLCENVVRPLAQAVEQSPHRHRVIAWDVINEPEWAMTGPSPYGDEDYTPNGELDAVSHAQMETFVSEVIAVLREESDALVTVGGAAWKWAHAWTRVDLDLYQFHMYAWINDWYPYDQPPSYFDIRDKPVVMGEFPTGDLDAGISYLDVIGSWYQNGYAGALSWQYIEASPGELDDIQTFASRHPCETRF